MKRAVFFQSNDGKLHETELDALWGDVKALVDTEFNNIAFQNEVVDFIKKHHFELTGILKSVIETK